jgi:hypothetical protein
MAGLKVAHGATDASLLVALALATELAARLAAMVASLHNDAGHRNLSNGTFEAVCNAVLARVEAAGLQGITERDLVRAVRAFAKLEPRRRREVLETIAADHGVKCRRDKAKGRPRVVWFKPMDDEDEDGGQRLTAAPTHH